MEQELAILWIDDHGDARKPTVGHVCLPEQPEAVERVALSALNLKYAYITNIKPHRFRTLGIGGHYTILNASYFGVGIAQVAFELGLGHELSQKMPVLLKIFTAVKNKLVQQFDLDIHDNRYSVLETLRDTVCPQAADIPCFIGGRQHTGLDNAIHNSLQKLQANTVKTNPEEYRIVSAKYPRSVYFLHLINQKYPLSHDYELCSDFEGSVAGTDRQGQVVAESLIEDLTSYASEHAGFMHFEVLNMDSKHEQYVPLGMEIANKRHREWATLPEIIDLLNYSTLKLGACYATPCTQLTCFSEQPDLKTKFYSYTNGLVNESLWMAMSYKRKNEIEPAPLAAYIRAYDRILCRRATTELVQEGFISKGFSTGAVRFAVKKSDDKELSRLRQALLKRGLAPQFTQD